MSEALGPSRFFLPGVQSCCLVRQQHSCTWEVGAQARTVGRDEAGARSLVMCSLDAFVRAGFLCVAASCTPN